MVAFDKLGLDDGAPDVAAQGRGEVLGLRWGDVDLDGGTATIRSTRIRFGQVIAASTPKTSRGNRTIALGPSTVTALRTWRKTQLADRTLGGSGRPGPEELVVTNADGSAPNPEAFSNLFKASPRQQDCRRSVCTICATATRLPRSRPACR